MEKVDDGYSGVDFNRPGVREFLKEVKKGTVDADFITGIDFSMCGA